jgi:two-component system, OmpR family, response regulator MtrA
MPTGQTVLVVEDDEHLRHFYRTALTMSGFQVREARSGFEALRMLDSSPVDIVVLDLMLPGVDGYVVRQELAAHPFMRSVPVVIVTGAGGDLDYLDVPCVLRKPISADQLLHAVRRCLETTRQGQTGVQPALDQGSTGVKPGSQPARTPRRSRPSTAASKSSERA